MSLNQPIKDLEKVESIPQGTAYVVSMGNGSGVKAVTQEVLTQAVGEGLKIGNLEELETDNKESIVEAINEAAQSGGGGETVDILDSEEEIEANTEEGKVAGALALKGMFSALNDKIGFETRINPNDSTKIQWRPNGGGDWVNFTNALAKKIGSLPNSGSASAYTIQVSDLAAENPNISAKNFALINTNTSMTIFKNAVGSGSYSMKPSISYANGAVTVSGIYADNVSLGNGGMAQQCRVTGDVIYLSGIEE